VTVVAALWLFGLGSCLQDDAIYWAPYNGGDDTVRVAVGAGEAGPDVEVTLMSTTETVEIGVGTVGPGSGPVGTEHWVYVRVDDLYSDDVGRVTLETDGQRGLTQHVMLKDSAEAGLWVTSVTSLGDATESREDVFRFVLWRLSDKQDPTAIELD
jgi:hypothetical protein